MKVLSGAFLFFPPLAQRNTSLAQVPVLERGQAGVALEVAAEERLVGEAELVGDFLDAEVGRLQQGFALQNDVAVDVALGGLSADALDNARQVARGDAEFGGIEGDFPLGGAVLENELDEAFEQYFLPAQLLGSLVREQVLRLVVEVHQVVLDEVLEDLQPEQVGAVVVQVNHDVRQPREDLYPFGRDADAGMLLQEIEERRVEPGGDFLKQVVREDQVGQGEVGTGVGTVEDAAGQQEYLGLGRYVVGLHIYLQYTFSPQAIQQGSVFQLQDLVGVNFVGLVGTCHKRFVDR